jgi:hypothetical protein
MIDALIAGRLFGAATERSGQSGRTPVTKGTCDRQRRHDIHVDAFGFAESQFGQERPLNSPPNPADVEIPRWTVSSTPSTLRLA